MSLKLLSPFELLATIATLELQFITVHSTMVLQLSLHDKPLATDITTEGPLPCVGPPVRLQLTITGKPFAT